RCRYRRVPAFGQKISAILQPQSLAWRRFRSLPEESRSNQVIGDKDQDRGGNDGIGRRLPDALRPTPRIVPVVAAHQRDYEAENGRFYQPRDHIDSLEILVRAIEVGFGIEAELVDADEVAAEDSDNVGD